MLWPGLPTRCSAVIGIPLFPQSCQKKKKTSITSNPVSTHGRCFPQEPIDRYFSRLPSELFQRILSLLPPAIAVFQVFPTSADIDVYFEGTCRRRPYTVEGFLVFCGKDRRIKNNRLAGGVPCVAPLFCSEWPGKFLVSAGRPFSPTKIR